MLSEVIEILEKEADKCQHFAEECHAKRDENDTYDDLVQYWLGKRMGFLDAVKYLDRLEGEE